MSVGGNDRDEAERYRVVLSTEGFQIRDSSSGSLKADIWSSRADAERACEALSAGAPSAHDGVPAAGPAKGR